MRGRRRAPPPPARPRAAPSASPLRSPLLWLYGAVLLIHVGVHSGLAGWTSSYLTRTTGLDAAQGALVTAGFWLATTLGRVVGAGLMGRVAPLRILRFFLGGAVLGSLLLVVSTGSAPLSVAALLLVGLGHAPVFASMVGLAASLFPQSPGTAGSLVMTLGTVGGMLLPWLQGVLLAGPGPRAGVALTAAGTVAMLLLLLPGGPPPTRRGPA
ncbi:MAG: MFS transporter [Pseudomonadota bacterium]